MKIMSGKLQINLFGMAILLTAVLLFSGCVKKYGFTIAEGAAEETLELEVPKIYLGEDKFDKQELFRYQKTSQEKDSLRGMGRVAVAGDKPPKIDPDEFELNDLNRISAGEIDDQTGTDILAAGGTKAFILDVRGNVKKEIDYNLGSYVQENIKQDHNFSRVKLVDLDNDGKVEIAGHGLRIAAIVDLNGKTLWKYPEKQKDEYVDFQGIDVTDVDNDGKNEVLLTVNDRIEVYDREMKLKWQKEVPDHLTRKDLTITDLDDDGEKDILVGKTIIDKKGAPIRTIETPYSWQGFLTQKNSKTLLVKFENSQLNIFDSSGFRYMSYPAPLSNVKRKQPEKKTGQRFVVFGAEALRVRLTTNESKYLAVLAQASDSDEFNNFNILYIYDPRGKLVFHETIQSEQSRMAVLPSENGSEQILVTDDGKINIYSFKNNL